MSAFTNRSQSDAKATPKRTACSHVCGCRGMKGRGTIWGPQTRLGKPPRMCGIVERGVRGHG
eukprot:11832531-Heterocapsa_arctica.AAC.1